MDREISNREAFAISKGYEYDGPKDSGVDVRKDANSYWKIYKSIAGKGINPERLSYYEALLINYDISVESLVEASLTNLVYIDGSVVLVKDKLENGDTRIRQIDKEIIKDILKSVDYLPFLEELYDIIEFTKDTEAEERKSKK